MSSPPTDPHDPLAVYWNKTVSELVVVENTRILAEEAERHVVFSLLVMALVSDAFNGNKKGAIGMYPGRTSQKVEDGRYQGDRYGDRYFGHNIACIAVDRRGEIIDFEFNHNELYNSSAEHAEARLVRRIFNLNQSFDHWQTADPAQIHDVAYGNLLSAVTLYTSLESCAQCSGTMTLANVEKVVYLQSDPGQYRIGAVMYNLSNPLEVSHPYTHAPAAGTAPAKYWAPEPVGAEQFSLSEKVMLETAYQAFTEQAASKPFYISPSGVNDASKSITSFLCTDAAKTIFDDAAARFEELMLTYPDFSPDRPGDTTQSMLNSEVLNQARRFRGYVRKCGRRGTPHR